MFNSLLDSIESLLLNQIFELFPFSIKIIIEWDIRAQKNRCYIRALWVFSVMPIDMAFYLNPKYAIDNLLRAEIASKSATSLLFSISP